MTVESLTFDTADFEKGLDAAEAEFFAAMELDQIELCLDIATRAKQIVHVKDDVLQRSIGAEPGSDSDGKYVDVGIVVPVDDLPKDHADPKDYALAEEFGHETDSGSHVPAEPFMRPAMAQGIAARSGPVKA